MSKDKQIEEMARLTKRHCTIDNMCGSCDWETCNECLSEALYNAGYRKASEVAEEIFAEIEEMLNLQAKIVCETRDKYSETNEPLLSFIAMLDGRIYSLRVVEEHIAELKKKYTEVGR